MPLCQARSFSVLVMENFILESVKRDLEDVLGVDKWDVTGKIVRRMFQIGAFHLA